MFVDFCDIYQAKEPESLHYHDRTQALEGVDGTVGCVNAVPSFPHILLNGSNAHLGEKAEADAEVLQLDSPRRCGVSPAAIQDGDPLNSEKNCNADHGRGSQGLRVEHHTEGNYVSITVCVCVCVCVCIYV